MNHDPLCVELYKQIIPTPAESCVACSVIAKVRAATLRDAVTAIEAHYEMEIQYPAPNDYLAGLDYGIKAIKALGEQQ